MHCVSVCINIYIYIYTNLQLCFVNMCALVCAFGDVEEGEVEVVADSLCFCERLWHHQHNERAEICGGWKSNLLSHSWGGFATTINYLCVCVCFYEHVGVHFCVCKHACMHIQPHMCERVRRFSRRPDLCNRKMFSIVWMPEGDLQHSFLSSQPHSLLKNLERVTPYCHTSIPPRLDTALYMHSHHHHCLSLSHTHTFSGCYKDIHRAAQKQCT